MRHDPIRAGTRKPVNLSLDAEIVRAAREAGLNLSKISEDALRVATKQERDRQWAEQHRDRIDAFSAWLDEHGMPFEDLRVL